MTEQDAKKKGCPLYGISMIMLIAADKIDQIKVPDPDNVGCCIASDCAMWVATDNECKPQPESPGGTSTNAAFEPICYPAGYCGLTNKP